MSSIFTPKSLDTVISIAVTRGLARVAFRDMFSGIIGSGVWKQESGGRRPIQVRAAPAEGLTVMASRHYADDPALAACLAGQRVAALGHIGSALTPDGSPLRYGKTGWENPHFFCWGKR